MGKNNRSSSAYYLHTCNSFCGSTPAHSTTTWHFSLFLFFFSIFLNLQLFSKFHQQKKARVSMFFGPTAVQNGDVFSCIWLLTEFLRKNLTEHRYSFFYENDDFVKKMGFSRIFKIFLKFFCVSHLANLNSFVSIIFENSMKKSFFDKRKRRFCQKKSFFFLKLSEQFSFCHFAILNSVVLRIFENSV